MFGSSCFYQTPITSRNPPRKINRLLFVIPLHRQLIGNGPRYPRQCLLSVWHTFDQSELIHSKIVRRSVYEYYTCGRGKIHLRECWRVSLNETRFVGRHACNWWRLYPPVPHSEWCVLLDFSLNKWILIVVESFNQICIWPSPPHELSLCSQSQWRLFTDSRQQVAGDRDGRHKSLDSILAKSIWA